MSVSDMPTYDLPTSDLGEAAYRLEFVRDKLCEVNDDLSRQEVYDLMDDLADVLADVIADLARIGLVLSAVVG